MPVRTALIKKNTGTVEEKEEPFNTHDMSANQNSHCGEQCGGFWILTKIQLCTEAYGSSPCRGVGQPASWIT